MTNHLFDIQLELYKRGDISTLSLSNKQREALLILMDDETKEPLYGGGAGGGKTWLGCTWIVLNCMAYPDTKWFIGRKSIKDLEGSVKVSIIKVCKYFGIEPPQYNGKMSWFIFSNGSQIDFKECRYRPEDEFYERLGSIEYTGGWIEEGGEVPFDAYDTLKSRIGRHNNNLYNLKSKILITCNPKKNWMYKDFYKPWKDGSLETKKKFIQALVGDNEHLGQDYIDNLNNIKDKAKKQRLLFGNWEYDDDPSWLINDYDKLISIFKRKGKKTGRKCIICDAARFGSDKARITVVDGYVIIEKYSFDISKTTDISSKIKEMQSKHGVGNNNTIVDSDGVGGGVVDEVGCIGFVNNASPIKTKDNSNFDNIKSQCGFMLADSINDGDFTIECDLSEYEKEEIIEELEQLKRDDVDNDKKKCLIKKKDIKSNIGRSPDWMDVFLMRYYFDLVPHAPFKVKKR